MRNLQVCLLILFHFFHLNEVFTDFIDDYEERRSVADQGENQPRNRSYLSWRDLENDDLRGDAFETLLQGIYRQSHTHRGGRWDGSSFSTGAGDSDDFQEDSHNFARRPTDEEYPLWKISCRVSTFGNLKKR
jgi:hypothetical protein